VHERYVEGQLLLRSCGWKWVKTLRGEEAGDVYRFELATVENES
jgi:hypothetical protein